MEGVLATILIFHVLAEAGHILLPICRGIAQQQHRQSHLLKFHFLRAFSPVSPQRKSLPL
jgi:hypothetical protein